MKRFRLTALAAFLLVLILAGSALAAGSCVITQTIALSRQGDKTYQLIEWFWTCDASGNVSDTTTCLVSGLAGYAMAFDTKPGATTPTDLYDDTLLNQYGVDILGGKGADRSSTLGQRVMPYVGTDPFAAAVNGSLELRVINAGASKNGYAAIYLDR